MKIKKISITGMHKVSQKSYNINNNITYFVGPNGAGKSTILEAIQLALLGYIPGYAKTNEGIMKHSSGPVLAVVAELDDGRTITRTWMRGGTSVSSKESITGNDRKIPNLVGEIELPIFNFNEFRSMTANKLKEWFINFLPSDESKLNLIDAFELEATRLGIPCEELIQSAKNWITHKQEKEGLKGIELVKAANEYCKGEQSYVKGQIAKLQGTVESLVRYDDAVNIDEESIRNDLNIKKIQVENLVAYESAKQMQDRLQSNLNAAKAVLAAESFDKDPNVIQMQEKIASLDKEIKILQSDSEDIKKDISDLLNQKMMVPSANATCPYTKERCETAAKLASDSAAKIAELDKQIKFKEEEMAECSPTKISAIAAEIQTFRTKINQIQSGYIAVEKMQSQIIDVGNPPSSQSITELKAEIASLESILIKIEANKQYDLLTQTVTRDKFKLEGEMEVLKAWAKITDANGLQSDLMNKSFEDLENDMSTYLTAMFGIDTKAKFNLVSKANSFSFGLERSKQYIEFDYLSSGERCLFTLALVMCLLNRSNSEIRMIIIDDILDHLDSTNANQLFDALKNVSDIQFILAGVKECLDRSICVEV